MKNIFFIYYIILFSFIGLSAQGQGVNNVKLLDLTSNTNTSGSSFYVLIGSGMQVTTDYTFEAWIYVDSYNSTDWSRIMDRRTVFSFYLIDKPTGASGDFRLRFATRDNSDNVIEDLRGDGTDGSTDYSMSLQTWYHVAVSRDGTTARLFIDGTMVDNSINAGFILSAPSGNTVNYGARYWGSYARIFDGAFDEMRYSDIGRYTSNFTITINSPPHPTSGDPNTILLFNFDSTNIANTTSANTYSATAHGTLTYADWDGFPLAKLPLPITYINGLNTSLSGDGKVQLNWSTASESYNKGFEIQRSEDGIFWDSITFINGAGNSNIIRTYSALDNNPLEFNYYRLKQIDFDGTISYSETEFIGLQMDKNILLAPNPANNNIQIMGIDQKQIKSIIIYDVLGNIIDGYSIVNNSIDIHELNKGVYIIAIESYSNTSNIIRFIKN